MNLLDVALLALAAGAAWGGYRLGFVTRLLSWAGLLVGLFLAARLLPTLLEQVDPADQATVLVVSVGTVFAGSFLGQAAGVAAGNRLRPVEEDDGGVTPVDGIAGAVAGVLGVVLAVWLLLPVLGELSGWAGRQVRGSSVAQALDERLPDPPDTMQALRAFVGDDAFPQVFDSLRPTPELGPPPAATGLTRDQAAATARSVVLVEGEACGRIQDGTGWVVEDGLVVTNAHVVAGEQATSVVRDDGTRLAADVVAFDGARDLAVLAVPDLGRPPLPMGDPAVGDVGAVFGHPGGGPLELSPAEVARRILATGRDIYGSPGVDRDVLELAAELAPGDSGSPLVRSDGQVIGVVFAIASDRRGVGYALATDEVRDLLDEGLAAETVAGPCQR